MHVCILKLNGWPDTFDERVEALSDSVEKITLIRSMPDDTSFGTDMENISVYDVRPKRGSYVKPAALKPIVFSLHVLQASLIVSSLFILEDDQPEVVHAIDYALGGIVGVLVSKLFSVPLVVSVRALKEALYYDIMEREGTIMTKLKYTIVVLLSGRVYPQCDHIITKSAYQVDFLRNELGINSEFTTIPTGVDFNRFDPETVAESKVLTELVNGIDPTVSSEQTIVLYLSKIIPRKGPDRILEIITDINEKLPDDIVFIFVGEIRDPHFESRIRELQEEVDDQVILYPKRVAFKKVPDLISAADAVTLFSEPRLEGVPRILQESCVMSTPIIAPRVTGIKEAFNGLPGCYLVDRNSSEEFYLAVKEIHTNPPTMERSVFRDKFDMHQNYSKYAKIYESVACSCSQ